MSKKSLIKMNLGQTPNCQGTAEEKSIILSGKDFYGADTDDSGNQTELVNQLSKGNMSKKAINSKEDLLLL